MTTVTEALRPSILSSDELAELRAATDLIATWPAGSHVWGQYEEQTGSGVAICRTENVSACAPAVAALVDGSLRETASSMLGTDADGVQGQDQLQAARGSGVPAPSGPPRVPRCRPGPVDPRRDRRVHDRVRLPVARRRCRRGPAGRRSGRRARRRRRRARLGGRAARAGRRGPARRARTALQRRERQPGRPRACSSRATPRRRRATPATSTTRREPRRWSARRAPTAASASARSPTSRVSRSPRRPSPPTACTHAELT